MLPIRATWNCFTCLQHPHSKSNGSDGRLARNFLKGVDGDAINALLCGAMRCWTQHAQDPQEAPASLCLLEIASTDLDAPSTVSVHINSAACFVKREFLRDDELTQALHQPLPPTCLPLTVFSGRSACRAALAWPGSLPAPGRKSSRLSRTVSTCHSGDTRQLTS